MFKLIPLDRYRRYSKCTFSFVKKINLRFKKNTGRFSAVCYYLANNFLRIDLKVYKLLIQ